MFRIDARSIGILFASVAASAVILAGLRSYFDTPVNLSLVVEDRTGVLHYDAEDNSQTLRVAITSEPPVERVVVTANGLSAEMRPDTDGRAEYVATLPFPACTEIVNFRVEVAARGFRPGRRSFVDPIAVRPNDCANDGGGPARTFNVRGFDDPAEARCSGDGRVRTCPSLRAAVLAANETPEEDLIRLPAGRYVLSRRGTETLGAPDASVGDLDILQPVIVQGTDGGTRPVIDFLKWRVSEVDGLPIGNDLLSDDPDDLVRNDVYAKIDANATDRVFQVAGGAALRLQRVALIGGETREEADRLSGAYYGGAAVYNEGLLTMRRVALVENDSDGHRDVPKTGGAINNFGTLVAQDTLFARNLNNGAVGYGGALRNSGDATLHRTLIAYNHARRGAAIASESGVVRLENVTFHENGAPATYGSNESTIVLHRDSRVRAAFITVANNGHAGSARTFAAIYNLSTQPLLLSNSLLFGNRAGANDQTCLGRIVTLGGNVFDRACPLTGTPAAPDTMGEGRGGFFEYRGGFTPGVVLREPSGLALVAPFPAFDQRGEGFARRRDESGFPGGAAEPGAFEYAPRFRALSADARD